MPIDFVLLIFSPSSWPPLHLSTPEFSSCFRWFAQEQKVRLRSHHLHFCRSTHAWVQGSGSAEFLRCRPVTLDRLRYGKNRCRVFPHRRSSEGTLHLCE